MLDTTTATPLKTDDLVETYLNLRGEIEAKEEAHKQVIEQLKEAQQLVADALLERCNAENADSIKTPVGTVSRRVSSRYWTSDWDAMYSFIKEHDAPFLLEQRIHNGNMKKFLEDNPDTMPIGLNADRKFVIHVRRPTNK